MEKPSIFFSKHTKRKVKEYILTQAGVQASTNHEKYLGMSAIVGK
jgi:hypothetical protein